MLAGETQFLAPYVRSRSEQCEDRVFELTLGDRPSVVIATLPAIYESGWTLRTCDGEIHFLLDCSDHGEGMRCRAHDWPLPIGSQSEFPYELAAVAEEAPTCPREKSCATKKNNCGDDGLTLRRYDAKAMSSLPSSARFSTAFYEVEKCGARRAVAVRCPREDPYRCITTTRDLP